MGKKALRELLKKAYRAGRDSVRAIRLIDKAAEDKMLVELLSSK